jgi:hypothetical protein
MIEEITGKAFRRNQVWAYHSRPGEADSRITIGRVDLIHGENVVVHIAVSGLSIPNPNIEGQVQRQISRGPIAEEVLAASVTELTNDPPGLDGFDEGYEFWLTPKKAVQAGSPYRWASWRSCMKKHSVLKRKLV